MKKFIKGFTLIELLIVIAIIGILATIVIINVTGAKGKANNTRVISDMTTSTDVAVQCNLEGYYVTNGAMHASAPICCNVNSTNFDCTGGVQAGPTGKWISYSTGLKSTDGRIWQTGMDTGANRFILSTSGVWSEARVYAPNGSDWNYAWVVQCTINGCAKKERSPDSSLIDATQW